MLVYVPARSFAGRTEYACSKSSAVSPNAWPAMKAARFAAATCGVLAKRSSIQVSVGSSGRVYIQLTRPSAKKFFDRSASRGLTPSGATASLVSEVIGTSYTV